MAVNRVRSELAAVDTGRRVPVNNELPVNEQEGGGERGGQEQVSVFPQPKGQRSCV